MTTDLSSTASFYTLMHESSFFSTNVNGHLFVSNSDRFTMHGYMPCFDLFEPQRKPFFVVDLIFHMSDHPSWYYTFTSTKAASVQSLHLTHLLIQTLIEVRVTRWIFALFVRCLQRHHTLEQSWVCDGTDNGKCLWRKEIEPSTKQLVVFQCGNSIIQSILKLCHLSVSVLGLKIKRIACQTWILENMYMLIYYYNIFWPEDRSYPLPQI